MMVGAFRFPLATLGIIEASTTLRLSRPGSKEYWFKIDRAKIDFLKFLKDQRRLYKIKQGFDVPITLVVGSTTAILSLSGSPILHVHEG